ncbi:unnamed protein product [Euphydryas editha]
MRLKR